MVVEGIQTGLKWYRIIITGHWNAASLLGCQADQLTSDDIPEKHHHFCPGNQSQRYSLSPPSSTCHIHLIQFGNTAQRRWTSGDSKHRWVLSCLCLFHCLTHQEAHSPTVNVYKIRFSSPTALPLTSCLSNE